MTARITTSPTAPSAPIAPTATPALMRPRSWARRSPAISTTAMKPSSASGPPPRLLAVRGSWRPRRWQASSRSTLSNAVRCVAATARARTLASTAIRLANPPSIHTPAAAVLHALAPGVIQRLPTGRARARARFLRSHLRSSSSRARLGTPTSSTRSLTRTLRATPTRKRRAWTVRLGSGWRWLTSHSCCSGSRCSSG
jgi:hypothetical protein